VRNLEIEIPWTFHGPDDEEMPAKIRCALTPGTPDVRYLRNGDPGYPGDPAECEIVEAKFASGEDVPEAVLDACRARIEEVAWEAARDVEDAARERAADDAFELRRDRRMGL